MGKSTDRPETRVKNPEPDAGTEDWVIWAAWADRITFEEIERTTGLTETAVIQLMKRHQSPKSFRRWRERVSGRATKHRSRFEASQRDWLYLRAYDGTEP